MKNIKNRIQRLRRNRPRTINGVYIPENRREWSDDLERELTKAIANFNTWG